MDSGTKKRIVASAAVLAVLCVYTWSLRLREVPAPPAPDLDSVPREIGDRRAKDEYISPASLEVLGADLTLAREGMGYEPQVPILKGLKAYHDSIRG